MQIKARYLKRIVAEAVRHFLRESNQEGYGAPNGLAGYVKDYGDQKWLVIYDAQSAKSAFDRLSKRDPSKGPLTATDGWVQTNFLPKIMKAIIAVSPPRTGGNCWGAWEINFSGAYPKGAGFGGQAYKAAYALSDSGLIVPDRESVTGSGSENSNEEGTAALVWRSRFSKSSDRTEDAMDAPAMGSIDKKGARFKLDSPPPNNRTDTPDDDCTLHPQSADYLNWAYGSSDPAESKSILTKLQSNHEKAMNFYGSQDLYAPRGKELVGAFEAMLQDKGILQAFFVLARES